MPGPIVSTIGPSWITVILLSPPIVQLSAQQEVLIDLPPAIWTLQDRQFSMVRGVRELADGRVLVSDAIERFLYVVDRSSESVQSIGTHGDGPGEYWEPGPLYALGGDSTLLTDPITHRAVLVVGDRVVETVGWASEILVQLRGEELWGVSRDGRVLGVEGFVYPREVAPHSSRVLADSLRILLSPGSVFDTPGSFDTIAALGGQGKIGVKRVQRSEFGMAGGSFWVKSPLATEGQAWLFPDAWIAVAHPDPYRVDWRTPEGQWIFGAPLPFTVVGLNRREKCFAITGNLPDAGAQGGGGCRLELYPGWPEHMPPFVWKPWSATPGGIALQPAPGGMLLIQRTPTVDAPEARYDVVDRSGALRGTIRLRGHQAIVGHGHFALYVIEKDSMDLLTLSSHPWPPQLAEGR